MIFDQPSNVMTYSQREIGSLGTTVATTKSFQG